MVSSELFGQVGTAEDGAVGSIGMVEHECIFSAEKFDESIYDGGKCGWGMVNIASSGHKNLSCDGAVDGESAGEDRIAVLLDLGFYAGSECAGDSRAVRLSPHALEVAEIGAGPVDAG